MAERYNAAEISRMSRMILKTVNDMERNLEEIIKNLSVYRGCLKDEISADAENLVRNIRDRIDTIRTEFGARGQSAEEGAALIERLESAGLRGI